MAIAKLASIFLGCAATPLLAVAMIGCGGGPKTPPPEAKEMAQPKRPPAAPTASVLPIDPSLRGKARVQIDEAVASSDAVMRANGIEAAQSLEQANAKVIVLKALDDDSAIVRFSASMAAGKLRIAEAKSQLVRLAESDADDNVRVATRYALHRLGDTSRSHDLQKYSRHLKKSVRANTALVLGLLGEKTATRVLGPMQADRESVVRLTVAEALWRLGDQRGLDLLVAGTVSQAPDDQIICALALAAPKDQRIIEHVRTLLTSDYAEVTLAAARAVGELGSDAGYAVAQKSVGSRDPRQRAMAAWAFGAIGRTDSQPLLGKLLADGDPNVRLAAATAQLQLKGSDSVVVGQTE